MTSDNSRVMRFADTAMFQAQHVPSEPTVDVVDMTFSPLKVMAAPWLGYRGRFVLPAQVTDEEAMAFAATYVQESMRFAVKDNTVVEIPVPWTIQQAGGDMVERWLQHVQGTAEFYDYLIGNGIPAEDARKGLLIGTTTQIHYRTNLRDMISHSGLRLCSQAQYEWKLVWRKIVAALLHYGPPQDYWQQREIVKLFRPVCYATGKCEFMGEADRWCVIRDRVEAHHKNGDRPETWTDINPHEPLHPEAARTDNPNWR